ncbi:hypothetical protein ARMGADRAFT_721512 [Armillaria gallica]|uniref:Uncharacterized protein n=1 Tax=Armillaria gallica TaxID=47427 RepID=A0A2H3E1F9_ARMGA|nr:hypothetical protein ARMGADRAFT_721512 [Armillaria gallica]
MERRFDIQMGQAINHSKQRKVGASSVSSFRCHPHPFSSPAGNLAKAKAVQRSFGKGNRPSSFNIPRTLAISCIAKSDSTTPLHSVSELSFSFCSRFTSIRARGTSYHHHLVALWAYWFICSLACCLALRRHARRC